jgi:hypothetical protein
MRIRPFGPYDFDGTIGFPPPEVRVTVPLSERFAVEPLVMLRPTCGLDPITAPRSDSGSCDSRERKNGTRVRAGIAAVRLR